MKNQDTLYRRFSFSLTELDALKEYLRQMALKGWMVHELLALDLMVFKKCQPQDICFGIGLQEPLVTGQTVRHYISRWEASGWMHAASHHEIHIFYTESKRLQPPDTDQERSIWLTRKGIVCKNILYLALTLIAQCLLLKNISVYGIIESYWGAALRLILVLLGVMFIYNIIEAQRWYGKNTFLLLQHLPIEYYGLRHRTIKRIITLALIYSLMLFGVFYYSIYYRLLWYLAAALFILLLPGILWSCIKLINIKKARISMPGFFNKAWILAYTGTALILICIILIFLPPRVSPRYASVPLSFKDLGVQAYDESPYYLAYNADFIVTHKAIDLRNTYSRQGTAAPYLTYEIIESKNGSLFKMASNARLKLFLSSWSHIQTDRSNNFHSNIVYYTDFDNHENSYAIVYNNRLVIITTNIQLTDNQMQVIYEKLGK